ncbi:MAG: hypothetical protein H6718_04045 [Polyangiaceae bacterium]|nr:hypothetical protein [Polyangiaceae bacterium]
MSPKSTHTLDISHMFSEVDAVAEALMEAERVILAMPLEQRRQLRPPPGIFELGVDGRFKLTNELESFLVKLGVSVPPRAQG